MPERSSGENKPEMAVHIQEAETLLFEERPLSAFQLQELMNWYGSLEIRNERTLAGIELIDEIIGNYAIDIQTQWRRIKSGENSR